MLKQRLQQLLPAVRVFLGERLQCAFKRKHALWTNHSIIVPVSDVDDLEMIGELDKYIKQSNVVLTFLTIPYTQSKNCIFELRSAVRQGKGLIALMDYDTEHGGVSASELQARLVEADSRYERWGFDIRAPRSLMLHTALTRREFIEWSRLTRFQIVSLKLIADQLLQSEHSPRFHSSSIVSRVERLARHSVGPSTASAAATVGLLRDPSAVIPDPDGFPPRSSSSQPSTPRSSCTPNTPNTPPTSRAHSVSSSGTVTIRETYVEDDAGVSCKLAEPQKAYHLFCSPSLPGAVHLARELRGFHGFDLRISEEPGMINECDHFLLYLHGETWRCGLGRETLVNEVEYAIRNGIHLLLAHEMPGLDQEGRQPVEFASFFEYDHDTTPPQLLRAGVYEQAAVPLKGGSLRPVSMALLADAIKPVQPLETVQPAKASGGDVSRQRGNSLVHKRLRRARHSCINQDRVSVRRESKEDINLVSNRFGVRWSKRAVQRLKAGLGPVVGRRRAVPPKPSASISITEDIAGKETAIVRRDSDVDLLMTSV